jgi:dTDP-4-dehydrorhamnose 3,5-epimerase
MQAHETAIAGVLELQLPRFADHRGFLVKPFQASVFERLGLPGRFDEQFCSTSGEGVVRGLHFQLPPRAYFKVVTCLAGAAWDVVLDVRAGSPTFGEHVTFELDPDRGNGVAVPPGCAHGFLATAPGTVLAYWATQEHSAEHDGGIRWDSAGIPWPLEGDPVLSPRDAQLPALRDFATPFTFR